MRALFEQLHASSTKLRHQNRRALGRREVREEARAAKHVNAKQAHSKQPGPLKLLHLMRSCDPEKKPDFILLISGSTKIA